MPSNQPSHEQHETHHNSYSVVLNEIVGVLYKCVHRALSVTSVDSIFPPIEPVGKPPNFRTGQVALTRLHSTVSAFKAAFTALVLLAIPFVANADDKPPIKTQEIEHSAAYKNERSAYIQRYLERDPDFLVKVAEAQGLSAQRMINRGDRFIFWAMDDYFDKHIAPKLQKQNEARTKASP
jgi:hypothetical protein